MSTKIFVNLPVEDLSRSVEFFTKLGFSFNPQFTDENATSMVIGEDIFVMLLVKKFFQTFTPKSISDAFSSTEVINSLSVDSKEKVDELVDIAFSAGAKPSSETQDFGWMYSRGFEDLDGHLWEFAYMDINAFPQI
ncbi:MAG: VOC family protein [Anaerolineaceae bacterium]